MVFESTTIDRFSGGVKSGQTYARAKCISTTALYFPTCASHADNGPTRVPRMRLAATRMTISTVTNISAQANKA